MDTIKIFKNYGCLAAEKCAVYTYGAEHPTAVCSEVITVKIPDGWKACEDGAGDLLIEAPWGWTYTPNELLTGNNTDSPYFRAVNNNGGYVMARLEVIE